MLLRWFATQPDPVVKAGDWIADVTYEREPDAGHSRFYSATRPIGWPNPFNNGEWDNLPAQRCFWYQVQKVMPARVRPRLPAPPYRSMIVYVDRTLEARTLLTRHRHTAVVLNAALDLPLRRQRDPADVLREVRGVVASGEWTSGD